MQDVRLQFRERARHYRALHRDWHHTTQFFGAAAVINELLHRLNRWGILGQRSLQVLESLGRYLQHANVAMPREFARRTPVIQPNLLNRALVRWEQRNVEVYLRELQARDQGAYDQANCELNQLLNHSALNLLLLCRAPVLRVFGSLSREGEMHFDQFRDRVRIGDALIDTFRDSTPE